MIPNENCYCELDPDTKDKFGIPVLRFHWKWSEHELNQAVHAKKTFAALIEAMGGTPCAGQGLHRREEHREARQHHPRGRRRHHRRRPEEVGRQRSLIRPTT